MISLPLDHSPERCLDRLSFNTATVGNNQEETLHDWPIEKLIDICAEKGFSAITFWRNDLKTGPNLVADRAKSAGLKISGLCRSPFLIGPLASSPTKTNLELRHSLEDAAELGAPALTVCVGGIVPGTKGMEHSFGVLAELLASGAEAASQVGVRLALEPLHPMYAGSRSCVVTTKDAISLMKKINHPAMSIALDVYHIWWDQDLERSVSEIEPGKIEALHLCDWLPNTQDLLLDRGMMGDGVADLPKIRKILYSHGFSGFEEVEIFSANNWWRQDPSTVLETCVNRFLSAC
ncbi:hydroxypyruvate isomerase [Roseibium album]|nr:hydroxypyruvate isomerase [Roseibium album]